MKKAYFNSKIYVKNMDTRVIYAVFGVLAIAVIIVVILIINNTRKNNIRNQIEDLNVRFNTIKTIPLAFKLNKAQAMAKRNEDTSEKVRSYYERYNVVEKHIEATNDLMEEIEDDFANRDYKHAESNIKTVKDNLNELETEVTSIDLFLDQFSQKENEQRDVSAKLKEAYRDIKMHINENANRLSIAYDGMEKKLEKCDELFSESEEWMYANDYTKTKETLDDIAKRMVDLKQSYEAIPELIENAKGIIPEMLDEASMQYDLARQRGVYLDNLNIDTRLKGIQEALNISTTSIISCEIDGVKQTLDKCKTDLSEILSTLEGENKDYTESKNIQDKISISLEEMKNLYAYVEGSFHTDKERFNIDEIGEFLTSSKTKVDEFSSKTIMLAGDIANDIRPASEIRKDLEELLNNINEAKDELNVKKQLIDKNTNAEDRAKTQLIKLQVVLNEVEVKVQEYHLPSISPNYKDDLALGREKINNLKKLLLEVPIDIDKLSSTLDETIDFIYTFYNNVNNIVGMAIMVENAIVFGNKYRSTYKSVDRDLSNAEFSYLNGEYTKALTMAISCMETLFPNNANEKILESN